MSGTPVKSDDTGATSEERFQDITDDTKKAEIEHRENYSKPISQTGTTPDDLELD